MSYIPQTWVDGAAGGTPIDADRLSYMEAGIAAAANGVRYQGSALDAASPQPVTQGSGTITMTPAHTGEFLLFSTDQSWLFLLIADITLGSDGGSVGEEGSVILVDFDPLLTAIPTADVWHLLNPGLVPVLLSVSGTVQANLFTGMLVFDNAFKYRLVDQAGSDITSAWAGTDYLRISFRGLITNV